MKGVKGLVLIMVLFCVRVSAQNQTIHTGKWRGVFAVVNGKVPFQLDISVDKGAYTAIAINGSRRDTFELRYIGSDSVLISLNSFEAALFAKIVNPGLIEGAYQTPDRGAPAMRIPFRLVYGEDYRFNAPDQRSPAKANISGKWRLRITSQDGVQDRVAVWQQSGSELQGIILSVTGDSRELQGEVDGDRFYLSGFTGSSPVLVTGRVQDDGKMTGEIGTLTKTTFEAVRDDKAVLPDAHALTFLKPGRDRLHLNLPDLSGKLVSLDDPKYTGKVVIVEIMGSWCPNCMDQIEFLSPWFNLNKHRGVEVIAVAFEARDDVEYARRMLTRLSNRYNIRYDILFGGKADNRVVADRFDDLSTFLAFPTTIIIGRDGKVRDIHTGFSGKGTGVFYDQYVKKFTQDLDRYLAEPAP